MQKIWNDLSPQQFEQLCCLILEANNFTNIQWFGESGNDKGRDIIANKEEEPLPGIKNLSSWIIQCKRYTSKPPTKDDLASFLNAAREHSPSNLLFAVTNTLTANVKDWLESIRKEYRFNIYLWEERDLEREIQKHKIFLGSRLPQIFKTGEPVLMYKRELGEIRLGSNEFLEVEIVVSNEDDVDKAIQKAAEFLEYIKQNGFEWWT